MNWLLGLLAKIITGIFGEWQKDRTAKEAGALAQEVRQHETDTAVVAAATDARERAVAPGVPDDPRDFRD